MGFEPEALGKLNLCRYKIKDLAEEFFYLDIVLRKQYMPKNNNV